MQFSEVFVSKGVSLTFFPFFFLWLFSDDHFFDVLTARTCHGHPLPCNSAGTCVSEADAASVFAIGDFEYECVAIPSVCPCCVDWWAAVICSYIWHAAQNASNYTSLTFGKNVPAPRRLSIHLILRSETPGTFFAELAVALEEPTHRLALYVGHDSTLVRLLAGIGAVPLRWPSFGSEVVFEVCAKMFIIT